MSPQLRDNDPLWEKSSGGGRNSHAEWTHADIGRARTYYLALDPKARAFHNFLMDRPGQRIDADTLIEKLRLGPSRHSVSGILTKAGRLKDEAGRRFPFYWWAGANGDPSLYAMKPAVAEVFREARDSAGLTRSKALFYPERPVVHAPRGPSPVRFATWRSRSMSTRRTILPDAVRGIASTNS